MNVAFASKIANLIKTGHYWSYAHIAEELHINKNTVARIGKIYKDARWSIYSVDQLAQKHHVSKNVIRAIRGTKV